MPLLDSHAFAFLTVIRTCIDYHISIWLSIVSLEPSREKVCLRGFRPGKTQSSLLSYRDQPEILKFQIYKLEVSFCLGSNNKSADQTARMRKLICAFVVRIWHKIHFLMTWLIYFSSWYKCNRIIRDQANEVYLLCIGPFSLWHNPDQQGNSSEGNIVRALYCSVIQRLNKNINVCPIHLIRN